MSSASQPLNVLVYLYTYPPQRFVGGELMTIDLLEYLQRRGHTVHVYARQVTEPYVRNGISVEVGSRISRRIAIEHDVFITHPEIRTDEWTHVKGMPYMGIVHNCNTRTLRSLERYPPTMTVVGSEFTKAQIPLAARNNGLGVRVIPPPLLIEPMDGPHDCYGMVNLSPEKGGYVLQHVARQCPDLHFLGVIGGHGEQVIDQPNNVEIVMPTDNMRPVYARMRALLFPSRSETYGKVVAEAMRFGVPVISSRLPAVHEYARHAIQFQALEDLDLWVDNVRHLEDPAFYEHWSLVAWQRGQRLHEQSLEDLERWEALVVSCAS